jgi:hypothetical protein
VRFRLSVWAFSGLLPLLAACAGGHACPEGYDPAMCRYDAAVRETVGITERDGPRAALDRARAIIAADPDLESLCHGLVHEIGHAAYERDGFEKALLTEDDLCGSGYVHGIVESRLGNVRDIVAALPTICEPDSATCFHGVGHGLMYKLDDDLPRSVELCGTFPRSFQRIQCAEGVFMETYDSETRFHASAYLKEDDPFFACRGMDAVNEGVCAFYATRYYLRLHPRDYAAAMEWCMTGVPEGPRDACAKGVGASVMKQNVNDPSVAEAVCDGAPPGERRYCVEGLVSYAIVHAAKASAGAAICPMLQEGYRATCERVVEQSAVFYPG